MMKTKNHSILLLIGVVLSSLPVVWAAAGGGGLRTADTPTSTVASGGGHHEGALPVGTPLTIDFSIGLPQLTVGSTSGSSGSYSLVGGFQAQNIAIEAGSFDGPLFRRGDVSTDGILDLVDGVQALDYLFLGGSVLCLDAVDVNDDGNLNLSDGIYLLNYLYLAGPAPLAPGTSQCGPDPTDDALECDTYNACG